MSTTRPNKPLISHMVLNVRDINATHAFYTEILGFIQVGQIGGNPDSSKDMRFYQGNGAHHHDIACVQMNDPSSAPEVVPWQMFPEAAGIVHIALDYGSREAWLEQIEHLQRNDVEIIVRGNHGMTHSAYIADPDGYGLEVLYNVPSEAWQDDVDAALNYFEYLPVDGDDVFEDRTDYQRFGPGEPAPAGIPDKLVVRID